MTFVNSVNFMKFMIFMSLRILWSSLICVVLIDLWVALICAAFRWFVRRIVLPSPWAVIDFVLFLLPSLRFVIDFKHPWIQNMVTRIRFILLLLPLNVQLSNMSNSNIFNHITRSYWFYSYLKRSYHYQVYNIKPILDYYVKICVFDYCVCHAKLVWRLFMLWSLVIVNNVQVSSGEK